MRATKVLSVTREALRRYLDDQKRGWLREYGSRKAAELDLQEADGERLIHESGQERLP